MGKNILHLKETPQDLAKGLQTNTEEVEKLLDTVRGKLFAAREKRARPGKDDKILADWNGLMIAALAKGSRALKEPAYAAAARKAADFILAEMLDEKGRLYHRYKDGEAGITGFLDDYAFLVWGLLELYEATLEVPYLRTALNLNKVLLEHFWDERSGGFFMTADYGEDVLVRMKEIYDGAVPSGNSVAMLNLLRLSHMTGDSDLEKKAAWIGRAFSGKVRQAPSAFTQLMSALDFAEGPSYEVVVVGKPDAEDTRGMLGALRKHFMPNKVILFRPVGDAASEITELAGFTQHLSAEGGKATAYVCRDHRCEFPTTDIGEMLNSLSVKR